MDDVMLQTNDLTVGYRDGGRSVELLSHLDLTLKRGHLVALLGQNGAGKSTLLRAITCTTPPLAGRIVIGGSDAATLSRREVSRLIGLVSTDRIAAGGLTVTELVALGRQPHTGFLGRMSAEDHQMVERAIAMVGMTTHAHHRLARLSDGERQKVMIARALAQETPIIVLDEPTAFLDVASRIETMQLLRRLAVDEGKSVLLSSHDVSQSLLLAHDLWLITHDHRVVAGDTGELVEAGAMDSIFDAARVTFSPALKDFVSANQD